MPLEFGTNSHCLSAKGTTVLSGMVDRICLGSFICCSCTYFVRGCGMCLWTWAAGKSGLTDLRDQRVFATLVAVVDHLHVDEASMAFDIICQRSSANQLSTHKGGTWERAEKSELIPIGSHLMAPPGCSNLHNDGCQRICHSCNDYLR